VSTSFASLVPQLQRAQLLLQQGRGGDAWSILAPLRQAMDGHGQALRLYTLAAQGVGRVDEAASALQRILELEGSPPEIIGALADMLGQAGRHSDALVHWDRLVALRPDLSDAHLNRAIAASESGQHERAIAAADAGLKRFKGHARLMAVKALALKNTIRIDESVADQLDR
jgi:tetratricopeptide (TPR) repeat protein